MIIVFGILAPWISVNYTWRWVYFITSALGIFAWFFLIAFVPESRRQRSKAELGGYTTLNSVARDGLLISIRFRSWTAALARRAG
jgi:predicted MFS family arabinose efflux permease